MATLPIDGEDRRVVLSVPKNGFVYLLDAKTGEFISGRNYVPVNWAKGLDDETGRPIFDPAARYWEAADGEPRSSFRATQVRTIGPLWHSTHRRTCSSSPR